MEAVQAIARLHADHHKNATPLQRMLGSMTSAVAHPWFAGLLTAAIAGWVGFNLLAAYLGQRPTLKHKTPW